MPDQAKDAVSLATATERVRCVDIVQWCREQGGADFRSIIGLIQSGLTVEQLKAEGNK